MGILLLVNKRSALRIVQDFRKFNRELSSMVFGNLSTERNTDSPPGRAFGRGFCDRTAGDAAVKESVFLFQQIAHQRGDIESGRVAVNIVIRAKNETVGRIQRRRRCHPRTLAVLPAVVNGVARGGCDWKCWSSQKIREERDAESIEQNSPGFQS